MRDIGQANALGVDTSDMVVVTHPDKRSRFGGPVTFNMTRLAYVKRGMEQRGYEIIGEADTAAAPTAREQSLLAEVETLRQRIAEHDGGATPDPGTDEDRDALRARLDALGVKYHHKSGVAKLQTQLDEAVAALNDDSFGDEDDDPE